MHCHAGLEAAPEEEDDDMPGMNRLRVLMSTTAAPSIIVFCCLI